MTICVTGIDMPAPFDTVHRNQFLEIAGEVLCIDSARIAHLLEKLQNIYSSSHDHQKSNLEAGNDKQLS